MTDHDDEQQPKVEPGLGAEAKLTETIRKESARGAPLAGVIHAGEKGAASATSEIEQGADVLCRDGDKIGEVVEVRPGYLVVEEGFFDPRDLYIPPEFIARHDETQIVLSIDREMFEASDWTDEPDDESDIEAEDDS